MSKVKLLLDVVEDLRSLADSVQAVADAMLQHVFQMPELQNAAFRRFKILRPLRNKARQKMPELRCRC